MHYILRAQCVWCLGKGGVCGRHGPSFIIIVYMCTYTCVQPTCLQRPSLHVESKWRVFFILRIEINIIDGVVKYQFHCSSLVFWSTEVIPDITHVGKFLGFHHLFSMYPWKYWLSVTGWMYTWRVACYWSAALSLTLAHTQITEYVLPFCGNVPHQGSWCTRHFFACFVFQDSPDFLFIYLESLECTSLRSLSL